MRLSIVGKLGYVSSKVRAGLIFAFVGVVLLLVVRSDGKPSGSDLVVIEIVPIETVPDIVILSATLEFRSPSTATLAIEIESREADADSVAVRLDLCAAGISCQYLMILVREIPTQASARRVFRRVALPGLPLIQPVVRISHVVRDGRPVRVAPVPKSQAVGGDFHMLPSTVAKSA